jgi:hypothetical protein
VLNIIAVIVEIRQIPRYKKIGLLSLLLKTLAISLVSAVLINQAKMTTNKNMSSALIVTSLAEVCPKLTSGEKSMEIIIATNPILGLIKVGINTRIKTNKPRLLISNSDRVVTKLIARPKAKMRE